jgi:hypothetical protein
MGIDGNHEMMGGVNSFHGSPVSQSFASSGEFCGSAGALSRCFCRREGGIGRFCSLTMRRCFVHRVLIIDLAVYAAESTVLDRQTLGAVSWSCVISSRF